MSSEVRGNGAKMDTEEAGNVFKIGVEGDKEPIRANCSLKDDKIETQQEEDEKEDDDATTSARKRKSETDEDERDKFMAITEEERKWAMELREAVNQDPSIDQKLSDFEYTQYAIFTGGDTEAALKRVRKIELFRKNYNIEDTAEDGARRLRQLFDQQPWMILTLDHDEEHGHFVFACDYSNWLPCRIRTAECWASMISGMYYLFQAANADLLACREGLVTIAECDGMSWPNVNIAVERRAADELGRQYPINFKETSWLNTPAVASVLFEAAKLFASKKFSEKIRLGCVYPNYPRRITVLYMMPSPEVAEERLLRRMEGYLARRYRNEGAFTLD